MAAKRARDLAAKSRDPANRFWKVFMQVPRSLRGALERAILADIRPHPMEDYDWNIRCVAIGNKALVTVSALHQELDQVFGPKQYMFDVDPARKDRDAQNAMFMKEAAVAKSGKKGSTKPVGYFRPQDQRNKAKSYKGPAKQPMRKTQGGRRR